MSFKASLLKTAIKLTPNKMIIWGANFILKNIAELTAFDFDIDSRNLYVQIQLVGESETIEVWLEDFGIVRDGESYEFIIQQAKSNRIWLHNLLAYIAGKTWKTPATINLNLTEHIELVAELFKAEKPAQVAAMVATDHDVE
jgi:hypothetical protein